MGEISERECKAQGRWIYFNIHCLCRIRVSSDQVGAYSLRNLLESFEVRELEGADLTLCNALELTGDYNFGTTAYKFLQGFTLINSCGIAVSLKEGEIIISGNRDLSPYVLPLIQWIILGRGASFVHGASVSMGGRGVLLPAWCGTGKTSGVVELLKIGGCEFMGDDLGIVRKDKYMFSFPKPLFIYPYHKDLFPHVFKNKPKLVVPAFLSNAIGILRQGVRPMLRNFPVLEQWCRKYTPEHMQISARRALLGAALADRVEISLIIFLERYNGSSNRVDELDTDVARRKVVGNLYFELGSYARELMMACGATGLIGLEEWFGRMGDIIDNVFAGHPIYRIRMVPMSSVETGKTIAETVTALLSRI